MVKLSKVQIGTPTLIKLHFIITRTKIYKKKWRRRCRYKEQGEEMVAIILFGMYKNVKFTHSTDP
jgi:hypothetical protein